MSTSSKKRTVVWPVESWSASEIAAQAQPGDMVSWRGAHPIPASRTEAHQETLARHLAEKGLELKGLMIQKVAKARRRGR